MEKLKVLIITGNLMPMHDYRRVNDVLRVTLEATGRFDVRITEEAHGITAETLAPYDMVLLNYDGMDEGVKRGGNGRSLPAAGGAGIQNRPFKPLGDSTMNAISEFVASGHGIFFFHTACSAHPDRFPQVYYDMIGSIYGLKPLKPWRDLGYSVTTHHESGHPVTDGVAPAWRIADDDFLSNATLSEGTTLIASIYDPVNDNEAPVMWCKEYGSGRSFSCALGHQEDTLRRLDWCRLFIHACDWLCTGTTTTVPLPDRDAGNNWMHSWPWYYLDDEGNALSLVMPIGY